MAILHRFCPNCGSISANVFYCHFGSCTSILSGYSMSRWCICGDKTELLIKLCVFLSSVFQGMAAAINSTLKDGRVLQWVWDTIRDGREDYLRSPLFPVFMSVTFYFVAVFPFMIIDLYGKKWHWVQQYKIQPNKEVCNKLWIRRYNIPTSPA